MKSSFFATIVFVLLQAPQPQRQQAAAPPTATIEGVVVSMTSGSPLSKARVMLTAVGEGRGNPSGMVTDAGGRFLIRGIAPGRYRLTASRAGFTDQEYGQRTGNSPGTVVVISGGEQLKDLVFRLPPAAAISGRVFDEDGEPVANVNVQAYRFSYRNGQRVMTPSGQARTNDLGDYRIFWMRPGQYFVSANAMNAMMQIGEVLGNRPNVQVLVEQVAPGILPPGMLAPPPQPGQENERYAPTYYPGTVDPVSAVSIDLQPGANFGGVDITLQQVTVVRIRGLAYNALTGQPAAGANVMLQQRRASGAPPIGGTNRARIDPQGFFEFRNVIPGSYDIIGISPNNSGGSRLSARVSVDAVQQNIDNISLALGPGVTLTGRVVLESGVQSQLEQQQQRQQQSPATATDVLRRGGAGPAGFGLGPGQRGGGGGSAGRGQRGAEAAAQAQGMTNYLGLRVNLRPAADSPGMGVPPAFFRQDGTLTITDVPLGDYQINVAGLPRGAYIKTARFGRTDVLQESLVVNGQPQGILDIAIAGDAGNLTGNVLDAERRPAISARVVIVPEAAKRQRFDLYKTANTDQYGRFTISSIPPGSYKVFAWADVEPGAYQDPDFLRLYEERGRLIRIDPSGQATVDVTLADARQ